MTYETRKKLAQLYKDNPKKYPLYRAYYMEMEQEERRKEETAKGQQQAKPGKAQAKKAKAKRLR